MLASQNGVTYPPTIIALPFFAPGLGESPDVATWSCCLSVSVRSTSAIWPYDMLPRYHVSTVGLAHARAQSSSTELGDDNDLTGTDSTDCTTYCARLLRRGGRSGESAMPLRGLSRFPASPVAQSPRSHVTLSMFHSRALTLHGSGMDTTRPALLVSVQVGV